MRFDPRGLVGWDWVVGMALVKSYSELSPFWKISFYELFRHVMYLKLNICIRCIYHYMILHDYIYIFIGFLVV